QLHQFDNRLRNLEATIEKLAATINALLPVANPATQKPSTTGSTQPAANTTASKRGSHASSDEDDEPPRKNQGKKAKTQDSKESRVARHTAAHDVPKSK